jgi:single-strand DNA-binding protein
MDSRLSTESGKGLHARDGFREAFPMQQNTLSLIGNLATDVALTTTEDDVRVARFRIAVLSGRWDRRANRWVNGEPTYVAVACWRRLADNVASSLRRGDPVVVTGRLKVYSVDRNGRSITRVEVDASCVGPDLNRTTAVPERVLRKAA